MPVAFITGAGIRVGRAIAMRLAAAGYDLILHAHRSLAPLEALADEARALGSTVSLYPADLSSAAAVDALASTLCAAHPAIDLVVHNAALFEKVRFEDVTREQFAALHRLNLETPYFLTQGLLPALRNAPAPAVVHITDIMGERATAGFSHYGVTKAALLYLTRALAAELAPQIRVNAVSPGTVAFPEDYSEDVRASILRRIPLGREGDPADIAEAVLFFAQNSYVTGQVMAVDGGRSAVL